MQDLDKHSRKSDRGENDNHVRVEKAPEGVQGFFLFTLHNVIWLTEEEVESLKESIEKI